MVWKRMNKKAYHKRKATLARKHKENAAEWPGRVRDPIVCMRNFYTDNGKYQDKKNRALDNNPELLERARA